MTNREISDKNYEHLLTFWEAFKRTTMKDYHDFYLKFDALLLVCLLETFRKESTNSFEIDTTHYSSTTAYSSDAIIRFADVKLKLISDIESINSLEAQ